MTWVVVWYVVTGVVMAGLTRAEARLRVEYDDQDEMDSWFLFVLIAALWGPLLAGVAAQMAWRAVRGG